MLTLEKTIRLQFDLRAQMAHDEVKKIETNIQSNINNLQEYITNVDKQAKSTSQSLGDLTTSHEQFFKRYSDFEEKTDKAVFVNSDIIQDIQRRFEPLRNTELKFKALKRKIEET